jgi:hypothetical protein
LNLQPPPPESCVLPSDHAVAPGPLRLVERCVGPLERGFQLLLDLPPRGDADADGDAGGLDRRVADATAQTLGDLKPGVDARLWHQDNKFVAAHPRHQI